MKKSASISAFMPKKKEQRYVSVQMDSDMKEKIEAELKKVKCSWADFIRAAGESFLAERGVKIKE